MENRHYIDVSGLEAGEYVDILLTVKEVDLNGELGDYIRIGSGSAGV